MILNKKEIKSIIPYAEPYLFLDEAEIINENEIVGFYQTHSDDYYFKGHFVDFPLMPGVLMVEALGQLVGILLRKNFGPNYKDYHFLAYDVRSCQFYKPTFPGDKVKFKTEVLGVYPIISPNNKTGETKIAHVKGQAWVNDELKCEARISVVIISKKEFEEKYTR